MDAIRCRSIRVGIFAFIAALGIAFLAADQVQAQAGGMVRGRGPAKKDRGAGGGTRQPQEETKWTDTGSDRCRILEFEPLKEGGDADVIGILRLRPLAKTAKTLKLLVRKPQETEDLQIRFDTGSEGALDLEMLSTLPLKNVLCKASWGAPQRDSGDNSGDKDKKKSNGGKERELRSLTLETVEVEGKIVSIEGDVITIKAKPTGGAQWPDIEARQSGQAEKKGNANPRIAQRKLKLRLIDDVTKFEAGNQEPLELGDFKEDQDVEAVVVCGSKEGLMVVLRAPGVEGEKKKTEEPKKPGQQPPPGRGEGQRRPGGVKKGGGI